MFEHVNKIKCEEAWPGYKQALAYQIVIDPVKMVAQNIWQYQRRIE